MKVTLAVVLLSSLVLQGCAFAPGQYMSLSDVTDKDPDGLAVTLVNITPATLAQQQKSAAAQAKPLSPELMNYKTPEYIVGPGDTLLVTVFEHPELTAPRSQELLNEQHCTAGRRRKNSHR